MVDEAVSHRGGVATEAAPAPAADAPPQAALTDAWGRPLLAALTRGNAQLLLATQPVAARLAEVEKLLLGERGAGGGAGGGAGHRARNRSLVRPAVPALRPQPTTPRTPPRRRCR